MKGKLYIHFSVDFPDSLNPEQCKALEGVLPPRSSVQLSDMELDECEETTLHDVNIEEEMRRKQVQEAYDEDEDMHGGAQRVQCAQQWFWMFSGGWIGSSARTTTRQSSRFSENK